MCKSHVKRNTEERIDEMRPLVAADQDGSLLALGLEPAQALADLDRLGDLVKSGAAIGHGGYIDQPFSDPLRAGLW